jgi:hypothetical protein
MSAASACQTSGERAPRQLAPAGWAAPASRQRVGQQRRCTNTRMQHGGNPCTAFCSAMPTSHRCPSPPPPRAKPAGACCACRAATLCSAPAACPRRRQTASVRFAEPLFRTCCRFSDCMLARPTRARLAVRCILQLAWAWPAPAACNRCCHSTVVDPLLLLLQIL